MSTIHQPGQPFIKGPDVENPFNERHDVDATHESIQRMLAGGTPNWVKWPHEYKSYVKESFAAEKEISDKMASAYKWDDQDILTNRQARMVNAMSTRAFVKKLNDAGIKTAVMDICKFRRCMSGRSFDLTLTASQMVKIIAAGAL